MQRRYPLPLVLLILLTVWWLWQRRLAPVQVVPVQQGRLGRGHLCDWGRQAHCKVARGRQSFSAIESHLAQ